MWSIALSDRASRRKRWRRLCGVGMVSRRRARRDAITGHHQNAMGTAGFLVSRAQCRRRKPTMPMRRKRARGGCLLHNNEGAGAEFLPRAGTAETP
jgi:hypothetical protein